MDSAHALQAAVHSHYGVRRMWARGGASKLGPVHTIFARCVAIQKSQALGAKRSWGAAPARLGNDADGSFGLQPEGKAMQTASLVVAFLAKAPALASSRA